MDIHEVSNIPQFAQVLLQQKETLRAAQSRKGKRPIATKSPAELIFQFRLRLLTRSSDGSGLHSSFVPPAYHPCIKPLCDLKKVMIKDLLLETHHRGTYIVVKSLTPPDRMTAVMAVVGDENDDVLVVQLYNQEEEKDRAAEDILGEGTILIVKEPYLKMMSDGDYGLRVDHLSDVIFLPIYDERVPEVWQPRVLELDIAANAWKAKGNDYFNKYKYHEAIEW
jgi:hypothetical protein